MFASVKHFSACINRSLAPPDLPSTCDAISVGNLTVAGDANDEQHLTCPERYVDLVSTHHGDRLLLTRVESLAFRKIRDNAVVHETVWTSLLRFSPQGSRPFSDPWVGLPSSFNMSHNAALVCLPNGSIVAYGGRRKLPSRGHPYDEPGIYRSVGDVHDGRIRFSRPQLVDTGAKSRGCIEERHNRRHLNGCEFDGKLSVVHHRGLFHLYARANLDTRCGGRFVQRVYSKDGVRWSRWRLLNIEGVKDPAKDNIYFFAVNRLGKQLVAVFPGLVNGFGSGVFLSTSEDGLHWKRPVRLLPSTVWPEGRTRDHPVDGIELHNGRLVLRIIRNVQLAHRGALRNCTPRPLTCRYEMDATRLLQEYAAASTSPPK